MFQFKSKSDNPYMISGFESLRNSKFSQKSIADYVVRKIKIFKIQARDGTKEITCDKS